MRIRQHGTNSRCLISHAATGGMRNEGVAGVIEACARVEKEVVGVCHTSRTPIDKASVDGGHALLQLWRFCMHGAEDGVETTDGAARRPSVQEIEKGAIFKP